MNRLSIGLFTAFLALGFAPIAHAAQDDEDDISVSESSSAPVLDADLAEGCFHDEFKQVANPLSVFKLAVAEIDESSLSATVDGTTVTASYQSSQQQVSLSNSGSAASNVSIRYCLPKPDSCAGFECGGVGI